LRLSIERRALPILPRAPAFDTAATSSGEVYGAIGAWIIGDSIPRIVHKSVRTVR
jgi:hypothetical protein